MYRMVFIILWVTFEPVALAEYAEIPFPVVKMDSRVSSSPDRMVLHMVGLVCVLGVTTNLPQLHGLGAQQEVVPSGFRSRALLSTSDASPVKVSLI